MNLYRIIFFKIFVSLLLGFALFHLFNGLVFEDWDLSQSQMITYIAVGLSVPLGYWESCRKRIKYLESDDFGVPGFKDTLSNTVQINAPEFSWKEFERRLGAEFVITAHQEGANAFKLRRRVSWFKSGAGAFLIYNEKSGTMKCWYFAFPGYMRRGKRGIQQMNKDIVEIAWRTSKS